MELESFPVAQVANDKDGADGEDGKGIDDIEHGSIEHSLMAEDGGYDRVAHKADIAEHQRKTYDAFIFFLFCEIAWQQ